MVSGSCLKTALGRAVLERVGNATNPSFDGNIRRVAPAVSAAAVCQRQQDLFGWNHLNGTAALDTMRERRL
ncbi:hypothetical protein B1H29_19400 [Streptomyces pactum]|uniref:Uncharacterized protein n=1 Tax=Streptomyces pactum TaxID=68249 RepID=A0A1S6JAL9_9ACTN|nr:hypothetical protein B1H29_19400 [Streptomyces pactum]